MQSHPLLPVGLRFFLSVVIRFGLFGEIALAAPIITATKDDNLAEGVRKLPGDNITYTIAIGNSGDETATNVEFTDPDPANTAFVSVFTTPIARNDSYSAIGNVQITVPAGSGLLVNDSDPDDAVNGPGVLTAGADATSTNGGNVSVNADGSFSYNPPPGFTGADTFTYTLTDTEGSTDTGTVSIAVTGLIWFVDENAASNGDGRLGTPFSTMANFAASPLDEAGDNIFLYSGPNYVSGVTLLNNQRLIGQGATVNLATAAGVTVPPFSAALPSTGGARPTIAVGGGTGVTLASGNNVQGLNVTNSGGSGIIGNGVGTLTLADFDVTVAGGSALSVTTSGTVTATGADNDLNSTNGTALNVNAVTIGAAGLTFKSISAGAGANNGISLVNTGGIAGLTVTGADGVDAGTDPDLGSGGTINGKTGPDGNATTSSASGTGVNLSNVRSISLNGMIITNHQNYGIRGNEVDGFRLTFSQVGGVNGTNVATPFNEGSVSFVGTATTGYGLRGTVAFLDNEVTGGRQRNVSIDNATGTMNLNFLRNNVHLTTDPVAPDDGFSLEADTSAIVVANISNNTFSGHKGDDFNLSLINNASVDLTFNDNILSGLGGASKLGAGIFILGASYNGTFKYDISRNNVQYANQGAAIFVNKGSGTATYSGQIKDNVVGNPANNHSGALESQGLHASARGAGGSHKTLITGNQIYQYHDRGIVLEAGEGAPSFTATVTNNTVSNFADGTNSLHGIHCDFGILTTDNAQITIDVRNNLIANAGNEPQGGVDFRMRTAGSNDVFVGGYSGGNSSANVQAYIDAQNPDGTTFSVSLVTSGGPPPATYNNGPTVPFTSPNLPSLPPAPLMFALGGVESGPGVAPVAAGISPGTSERADTFAAKPSSAMIEVGTTADEAEGIREAWTGRAASANVRALAQSEFDSLVAAALDRWAVTGLTDEQLGLLRTVKFEIADLPSWYLGEATGGVIRVDNNAGGNGWFVDTTPQNDEEFSSIISATRRYTDATSAPAGRIDLLTTILHEMGHALGLCDTYAEKDRDSLMYGFLTKGERRLPSRLDAAAAAEHGDTPHAHAHFLAAPLVIGDLPAGKTVTITYVVQINGATGATSTSNQGTVSGGNIANKVTDDPQTGATDDATVTPIEQPPTVGNVAKSGNEDTQLPFTAADFDGGFSDPNGDVLATVRVTSLPGNGTLKLGGVNVTVNQTIPRVDLGNLTYDPEENFNGPDSFGWNGWDGVAFADAGAVVNISVIPVNDDPVAGADTISRHPSQSVKVLIATLLGNDSDIDGGTVAFASVAATSAGGQAVTSAGGYVFYNPAPGFHSADSFTYTITDGQGGTGQGTVTVQIGMDEAETPNKTSIVSEPAPGGGTQTRVSFAGIPGRTYRVQSTDSLTPPNWVDRATVTADAQGGFEFVDPPVLPPARFYRSVSP